MNVQDFIRKWANNERSEKSASQEQFGDLCRLFEHPTANDDATGENFAFEKGTERIGGKSGQGWADVWKRGHFAWEYKGAHARTSGPRNSNKRPAKQVACSPMRVVTGQAAASLNDQKPELTRAEKEAKLLAILERMQQRRETEEPEQESGSRLPGRLHSLYRVIMRRWPRSCIVSKQLIASVGRVQGEWNGSVLHEV